MIDNVFATVYIHLPRLHPLMVPNDMVDMTDFTEAMEKADRFFHRIYQIPIVWLVTENLLDDFGGRFREWHERYGDEFAIMNHGILGAEALGDRVDYFDGWVERAGLKRKGACYWFDLPFEEQLKGLSYLKRRFDEVIGQNTRILACGSINADTIRAMKQVGLDITWGYCWNLFGDNIDTKGCVWYPFYVSTENHKAPAQDGDTGVLGTHWGPGSLLNFFNAERHDRTGTARIACLNAHELANRSPEIDRTEFVEKMYRLLFEQRRWNPYVHIPMQLEALWLDEGGICYGQHPRFNSASTEVFFSEVETVLRMGAQFVTLSQFADWHRERFRETPEMIWYEEDVIPEVRNSGKDHAYPPMLLYADRQRQFIFLRSHGFNFVRHYRYDPVQRQEDFRDEYPFDTEPKVCLRIKQWVSQKTGIVLTPEGARYSLEGFDLYAYEDVPDYACVLWEANIPDNVEGEDLKHSPNITKVRLLREKNIALLFARLTKGLNEMRLWSDKPNEFIRIKEVARVGWRFEIWIENSGPPAKLHTLTARIDPGLKVGGFWWNGHYHISLYHYGWSPYNYRTGDITISANYPCALELPRGLSRCSIEIVGQLDRWAGKE